MDEAWSTSEMRGFALELAMQVNAGRNNNARTIIEEAQKIEAYLNGPQLADPKEWDPDFEEIETDQPDGENRRAAAEYGRSHFGDDTVQVEQTATSARLRYRMRRERSWEAWRKSASISGGVQIGPSHERAFEDGYDAAWQAILDASDK